MTKNILPASLLLIALMMLLTNGTKADILGDADRVIKTVRQPIGTAASVCALTVSIQTDILGKDNVQSKCNIRRINEPLSKVSNKRDTLAGTARHVSLVLRQLGIR